MSYILATLLFLLPGIIFYIFNFYLIGTIFYSIFSFVIIGTNFYRINKLRSTSKINEPTNFTQWIPTINQFTIFILSIFFLIIGYFANYLPQYFLYADKIFHMIYNQITTGLILSVMAAIIFSFIYDYQSFVKKYYLFLELELELIKLWCYIISINSKYKPEDYYDLYKSSEYRISASNEIDKYSYPTSDEVAFIKNSLSKIYYLIGNFFINNLLNQKIYYLIKNIEYVIEHFYCFNDEYQIEEHAFYKIFLDFIDILNEIHNTKKSPFSSLIGNI